jgi:hypothetical protein
MEAPMKNAAWLVLLLIPAMGSAQCEPSHLTPPAAQDVPPMPQGQKDSAAAAAGAAAGAATGAEAATLAKPAAKDTASGRKVKILPPSAKPATKDTVQTPEPIHHHGCW